jgi:hypothetical protein
MEEYKLLEDSYHELIVEHGKKRNRIQDLLLEIDMYKEKSNAVDKDVQEAGKSLTASKHALYEREQLRAMLLERKNHAQREAKDSFVKMNSLLHRLTKEHNSAYKTIMDYANKGMSQLNAHIRRLADEKCDQEQQNEERLIESSELETTIRSKQAKLLQLKESLRLKVDERERLQDECFDLEVILHDINREISATKVQLGSSQNRSGSLYDQETERLLEQKKLLENKKKQLTKDLRKARGRGENDVVKQTDEEDNIWMDIRDDEDLFKF